MGEIQNRRAEAQSVATKRGYRKVTCPKCGGQGGHAEPSMGKELRSCGICDALGVLFISADDFLLFKEHQTQRVGAYLTAGELLQKFSAAV